MARRQSPLDYKALLRRFRPSDATSQQEFSQALMRLQLKQGEEPSRLFTKIADLSNSYGVRDYPEQQVIAVIMNAIPPEYRAVVANEGPSNERLHWMKWKIPSNAINDMCTLTRTPRRQADPMLQKSRSRPWLPPQREHAGSVARQATRRKTAVRDQDLENVKLAVVEMIRPAIHASVVARSGT
jgi:hypothetical protein